MNIDMLNEIQNLQLSSTWSRANRHEVHRPRTLLANPRISSSLVSLEKSGHKQPEQSQVAVHSEQYEDNRELQQAQQSDLATPDHRSRYNHNLPIMLSTFGSTIGLGNLITAIRTGDCLIRDDAPTFLRDHLPRWKGMWYTSTLLVPSRDESAIDHFVKISRCLAILNERSSLDRVHILLNRVLQYQFYLHTIRDIKQNPTGNTIKKRGVKNAKYALDHLLKQLYIDDWDLASEAERVQRRIRLHKQNNAGKRLLALSNLIGFGIHLLVSADAISTMKVFPLHISAAG